VPDFVVVNQDGEYMGMVTGADMRTALIDREAIPLLLVAELVRTDIPTVHPDETLDTVLDKFAKLDVSSLCLVHDRDPTRPMGLITRSNVMSRYQRALEES
jgi:CBS domain-containing protein